MAFCNWKSQYASHSVYTYLVFLSLPMCPRTPEVPIYNNYGNKYTNSVHDERKKEVLCYERQYQRRRWQDFRDQ